MGDKSKSSKASSATMIDARPDFLLDYLSKSMRLKSEKWSKMMNTEEYRAVVYDFLNNGSTKLLIFSLSPSGLLVPSGIYPPNPKAKSCYFKRINNIPLTNTNIYDVIIFGDLSPRPVEELGVLVDEVFLPLLSSPENHRGWPHVVADDVSKHLQDFSGAITRVKGAMVSETILPMPAGAEKAYEVEQKIRESEGEEIDLELKSAIEGAVIKWATIVNEILKEKSTIAFSAYSDPTPMREIEFWKFRLKTLESIYEQLRDPRVKKMAKILELTESIYLPCFKTLFRNVVASVSEARDIMVYLRPMSRHFEGLEGQDFTESRPFLKPLLHCLCLLWSHSRYYCMSSKIVVLVRELANSVIQECSKQLDPGSVFQGDVEDTFKRFTQVIEILKYFVHLFEQCRTRIHLFFPHGTEPVLWTFHPRTVFERLFQYITRLETIHEFFQIVIEFSRLEKVEIAGIRGRMISQNIQDVMEEFTKLTVQFQNSTYDSLDPADDGFIKDYEQFLNKIKNLDRRLAALFSQAYDECYNLESIFKLLVIIGNLLERPIIREELTPKLQNILALLHVELDTTKILYDQGMSQKEIPRDHLFPPVAGSLYWLFKLKSRIERPINDFRNIEHEIKSCDEAQYIYSKYDEMMGYLTSTESKILTAWCRKIPATIAANIVKPVLVRTKDNLLELNFDPELVAILREVRYLKYLDLETIPAEGLEFYARNEELQRFIMNLYFTVEWYNLLHTKTEKVEFAMIEAEVQRIDTKIDNAIATLNWSMDIWNEINSLYEILEEIKTRVLKAQSNIERVIENIHVWGDEFLFDRKDGGFLSLDERNDRKTKRYEAIAASATELAEVMEENYDLFLPPEPEIVIDLPVEEEEEEEEEEESPGKKGKKEKKEKKGKKGKKEKKKEKKKGKKGEEPEEEEEEVDKYALAMAAALKAAEDRELRRQEMWRDYQDFIDKLILQCMSSAVMKSMSLFLDEMNLAMPHPPLFEIVNELREPKIVFIPNIEPSEPENFLLLIQGLINDIITMAELMPRVSQHSESSNYRDDVEDIDEYSHANTETIARVLNALEQIRDYSQRFEQYSFLWLEDKAEFLSYFLLYSRGLTDEEKMMLENEQPLTIPKLPPTIPNFKTEIDRYENLYETVDKYELSKVFDTWLELNVKPIRQAILNHIRKWGNTFKDHLFNHVLNSLNDLEDFILEANRELSVLVREGDYETLVRVVNFLNRVKEKQLTADDMFGPIKEIIELLKNYNVEFEDDVYTQLMELPEKWNAAKKLAVTVKQTVNPLLAKEMELIRKRFDLFDIRQSQFLQKFKSSAAFKFPCDDVYDVLDDLNQSILSYENYQKHLKSCSELFEVNLADVREIEICRREVKLLKICWDYVNLVNSSMEEWKKTLWIKIDVESMEMECKKFAKELRQLDKDIRTWEPFFEAEAMVKNMVTSLRAITELQNPAIRDRHWIELMKATKVKFVMDDKTTLSDLLALQLHKFEEDVKNIVDKSVKEMAMEKSLKEMAVTWANMEFEYEFHERSKSKVLKVSEELVEVLEDNQVQLQNMMSSKYIDFFFTEVSDWQKKLSNADQVISIWFEVQRKWMYLESIFIGSEDIRNQLPEESRRFDRIDKTFRLELLIDMGRQPNVVKATNVPNLYEKLEVLYKDLVICEKALNDYLETKRLAYPRFYFVSSSDLLDILSNGNAPELVAKHLTKLYDSLAKLKFLKEGDKNSKKARGMFAKDEEYVEFVGTCDCVGKVEIWLNRVTDIMRKTLHYNFRGAVKSYEDKPRDVWLFDWPAQPALCGTQIWWTSEVNLSFIRLEEGFENAMKDYLKKQINQLNNLIVLLLGDLTVGDRQKIMTICTIDVHSRDVVNKMIVEKVDNGQSFQWASQLRHRWDDNENDCFANICDAQFQYDYEYLGNTPRLVITPLTDRCYITLTQSLHLIMGGAPAGPAGTGKTETTKDLGKALGVMVYVFNCSEQMDYKSCGNIYKGLAQTGAWGCFDEFNRISVEVLSVIAVQVKTVLDAIKYNKKRFNFMGEDIALIPTVGMFITMNPGYAGRAELPENLKALFRPCAMVVPDFALICEIMLVAEGFQEARLLARKFITLYTLCKELLSKQDHYDWGLRAIKSVLVVAGSLKRGDRLRPEDQVLMRALRDFNVPKIVTDDTPVFMGLIGDLFPALDVPRKRDPEFEEDVKRAAIDLTLQPEYGFVLKIVQLQELFAVRHSVFIIGFAGTGKSEVWRTLYRTYYNLKRKPIFNDLNPKAVTNDELFGIINPATREWKDGLISVLMREQALMGGTGSKWLVLDGDIDPMWIESLNTVMDDNKVLTLASNERIALTPQMRLLFEISNLRTATPATVSRAGILYINPQDLGWSPYVTSWIETRTVAAERNGLMVLFDKYVNPCLDMTRAKLKKITPIPEIAHIEMLCQLLDCLLSPHTTPPECPKEWYEQYFVFSCIWAFGSAMFQDQLVDWRNEFSKWWTSEFKAVKIPTSGTVFSFYIDTETKKWLPWSNMVGSFELDTDVPLSATLVDTSETARYRYFMDMLLAKKIPVMLVGSSGSGKSVIVSDKLGNLPDNYMIQNIPFNFYYTSEMLQRVMEKPLEKKAGRNYGPPGSKLMIYFIDDMNMPEVDLYGTVQPHTLIRQHMDYGHWYDRIKITLKDIHNVQYVTCMNPTAGSFTIDPRLQRHFCVFAVSFPTTEALFRIYETILSQHLANPICKFPASLGKLSETIVNVSLAVHAKVASSFLPTAIKFHYIFNLRDLSNIFQAVLFTTGECVKTALDLIRIYVHEATRVYCDKLVDPEDALAFKKLVFVCCQKGIEELDETGLVLEPLIYCHFAEGIGDPKYMPITSWPQLSKLLADALSSYNDLIATMNLVLFEDAMFHICRINRILESPRGNALLIGVGGSGKQSLSRLAASISSLEVFQVQLRKGYSINDLKIDFNALYTKAGVKNVGIMFLMTDSQVAEENFLVVINDILASGEIPELYGDDEVENIVNAMRNEVKGAGMQDTKENCWKYFIDRVRRLLKLVLCFSPVGSTLRIRARKFPAVVNCTSIDWFHEWPQDALESVSKRFLSELEVLPTDLTHSVSLYMSYVHTVVNEISAVYLQNEKRYNYTTPKSFLEQIALYSKLLRKHIGEVKDRIFRLTNGLEKLRSTAAEVDGLKETLAVQEVELQVKNKAAEELIAVVSAENEKVQKEKDFAAEEEAKVRIIEEDVTVKAKICEEDLQKAEPALLAAQEALNTLNKNNLTELKSFGSPPDAVVNVCAAVMVLMAPKGKVPKDRSWKAAKVMMGKVDQFLYDLVYYDKENIHPDVVKAIQPYIKDPEFDPEYILAKSSAAAGLCAWVINIMKFYDVYVVVEPKRKALMKANNDLKEARNKLEELNRKLEELEETLGVLKAEFDSAIAAKMKCQAEADATAVTIDLANRLVNGLASENVRWRDSVILLQKSVQTLPGDILQITAFISYVGCFTRRYRLDLIEKFWLPYLETLEPKIPKTNGLDPLLLLTDDAQIAQWNNEGLPSDRMSTENATILTNSARWPLMIDPQLQGIKWIKTRYGENLVVLRLTMRNYIDTLERALGNGSTVLFENIGENVDAVLDPLLGRLLIKKGRAIKIGDKEMDYNPEFRLILHTKLANPHYKPEMQAQCTLINFTVTRDGLEEQLLGAVVKAERPDLEVLKSELTAQQNYFKITLKQCEDNLLSRLSSAGGNILGDVELVLNLETTKKTSAEITIKVEEAKITSVQIDEAREQYRPAAARASLLYFILNDLHKINPIYQFSLKAFSVVFSNAITTSAVAEDVKGRVLNLIDNITFCVFMYTSRGLFERDKLIFMALMTLQILGSQNDLPAIELDYLLRFPVQAVMNSPVDFLTLTAWGGIKALVAIDEFANLDKDIEGSAKRWKKYVESEAPEKEKLPQDWKNKSGLQRLCIMRALRPDRMTYAMRLFIEEKLGSRYTEARTVEFAKSFQESSPITPIFFILSAGVDPTKDVETLGRVLGFRFDGGNFHNVSLGQGQEEVAENAMDVASREGHWVILQNIHLVAKWLPSLDKKMEQCNENAHDNYRLFMSAEPAADPAYHILPQGILESSIKITNEPPTGMQANLHKALDNFNQDTLEMSSKETEFKAILFSLCYFHACVAERRKFGPQGWNRSYPFNVGDLTISVLVLYNYLESNTKIPWEDLRYLFGEIMYGGHITDDWDRRLCRTFLQEYMQPELVDGELALAPGFIAPPSLDYVGYHSYIDETMPPESPYLYGLHPNAEIGFLTTLSEKLFKTIFELQPRDAGASTAAVSKEEKVKAALEDIFDKLPDLYNMTELQAKVEELTPFIIVAFQECERMNILVKEMRDSLRELDLGLKGELTITKSMEDLEKCLFMDVVPPNWEKRAYPSMLPLGSWFADLTIRMRELEAWACDFSLPPAVWLAGFFNPQSFLTAIMQQTARKNEWPLDKMCLNCDVTKRQRNEFTAPPREGAYICGLFMEGARWDTKANSIAESYLKELFPVMPVVYIKAVTQDKQDVKNVYECPVYKTRQRGPTFVWTFNLKTKEKAAKWTLAGVGLILQI